jgi:hypothetical protein
MNSRQVRTMISYETVCQIADGYGGHVQVLALFTRSESPGKHGPCRRPMYLRVYR